MTSEAKARLRSTLLAMGADAMSGPGGLAGYLRTRLLQVPYPVSRHHRPPPMAKVLVSAISLSCPIGRPWTSDTYRDL
jgi:hypothetical protein